MTEKKETAAERIAGVVIQWAFAIGALGLAFMVLSKAVDMAALAIHACHAP